MSTIEGKLHDYNAQFELYLDNGLLLEAFNVSWNPLYFADNESLLAELKLDISNLDIEGDLLTLILITQGEVKILNKDGSILTNDSGQDLIDYLDNNFDEGEILANNWFEILYDFDGKDFSDGIMFESYPINEDEFVDDFMEITHNLLKNLS